MTGAPVFFFIEIHILQICLVTIYNYLKLINYKRITAIVRNRDIIIIRINIHSNSRRSLNILTDLQHNSPNHGCKNDGNGDHQDNANHRAHCTILRGHDFAWVWYVHRYLLFSQPEKTTGGFL